MATTSETGIVRHIENKREMITAVLPQFIDHDRFLQMARSVVMDKKLQRCTEESITMCIYGCANLGLYPDPVLKHVYLIPFASKATIVLGYGGYIELASRSKQLGRVHTGVVYEGEEWEHWVDENGAHIKHVPDDSKADDKKMLRGYCVSKVRGDTHVEVVSKADWQKLKTFKTNLQWKNDLVPMVRKTGIIRSAKVWPLTESLALALHYDQQAELGKDQFENDPAMDIPIEPKPIQPDDLLGDKLPIINAETSEPTEEERMQIKADEERMGGEK